MAVLIRVLLFMVHWLRGRQVVMLCQPPLLYVQVSLVKHRAASLFKGRWFWGLFFVVSTPSSLDCKQPESREYVSAPPFYLWLERTVSGDGAPLARKQVSRDATGACDEYVEAVTRFFSVWVKFLGKTTQERIPFRADIPLGKGANSIRRFIPALSFAAFCFFCFLIQQLFPPLPVCPAADTTGTTFADLLKPNLLGNTENFPERH